MKRAGQTSGRLVSTERWRIQVAARKVARAQDQRSPETARSGAEPAPDRAELLRRPGDGFRVFESRRHVDEAGRKTAEIKLANRVWARTLGDLPAIVHSTTGRTVRFGLGLMPEISE
jgi:hypothetical protein